MPGNGPGRMNSEGESCHSGKLRLPFARCGESGLASCHSGGGPLPSGGAPHRRLLDTFQRKEGLRAKDL